MKVGQKRKKIQRWLFLKIKHFPLHQKKKKTHMRQQTKDVAHTPTRVQLNGTIIKEKKKGREIT